MTARLRARACSEDGYSLTELIAVLVILGGIVGAVTSLFVSGSKAETRMAEQFKAQNSGRVALDAMRRDVHLACAATVTTSSATLTAPNPDCLTTESVTWCTANVNGLATRNALRRLEGAGTCTSAGRLYADWLTTTNVFWYQAPSPLNLAKLKVRLPIRLPSMRAPYTLCDVLVLRNTSRSGGGGTAVTCP